MSQTKAQLIDNLVSPITGALGSASAPTFSFTADPNTGIVFTRRRPSSHQH
jgi:hypothetical protein